MADFSKAGIKRQIKSAAPEANVSADAVEYAIVLVSSYLRRVTEDAYAICLEDGRKTIKDTDLSIAAQNLSNIEEDY